MKFVIVRALVCVAGENTTLLTFLPITKPLVPAAVPVPSRLRAPLTATLAALASVMPVSGVVPPTSPASVIARPAESVSRFAPSTVEEKAMSVPALSVTLVVSVRAPANVCEPLGLVTLAPSRMPAAEPEPSVVRRTAPAPLAAIGLAMVIVSVRPAPVSMLKFWLTAPVATVFRATPPTPIVTVSVPVLPAMEMPENDLILFRLTEIVSAAEFTVRPGIGAALVSVPADRAAVIVRTLDAAL